MKIDIEISEDTQKHIDDLIATGDYASFQEYVDDLIRCDRQGGEPQWIQRFLLKRLKEIENSPRHEVTPELVDEMKAELRRRIQARRGEVA